MEGFLKQKSVAVNRLRASIKVGDVDEEIIPLLEFINSLAGYYSTSSCAGRIVLLLDLGSKKDDCFLGCWHNKVSFGEVREAIEKPRAQEGVVWLKFEPAIVHVVSQTVEGARKILVLGRESGFKRTGIQSVKPERILVEVGSTELMDVPILEGKRMLVSDEYLKYVVEAANKKYSRGQNKLKRLQANLKETQAII